MRVLCGTLEAASRRYCSERNARCACPFESKLVSRGPEKGRYAFADLAKALVLSGVWVQDRDVQVEKGAMRALPAALEDLSCSLQPQSKRQVEGRV